MPIDPISLVGGGIGVASSLIAGRKAKKEAKKTRREQRARVAKIGGIYDRLAGMYKPTGQYGESMREDLRQQGELAKGSLAQQYLRAGIGGTTYADVHGQYERQVGRQSRRTLEDYLIDKYAGIQTQKAQFLSGVQTTGPSYSDIAGAYSGVGTGIGMLLKAFKKRKEPSLRRSSIYSGEPSYSGVNA